MFIEPHFGVESVSASHLVTSLAANRFANFTQQFRHLFKKIEKCRKKINSYFFPSFVFSANAKTTTSLLISRQLEFKPVERGLTNQGMRDFEVSVEKRDLGYFRNQRTSYRVIDGFPIDHVSRTQQGQNHVVRSIFGECPDNRFPDNSGRWHRTIGI